MSDGRIVSNRILGYWPRIAGISPVVPSNSTGNGLAGTVASSQLLMTPSSDTERAQKARSRLDSPRGCSWGGRCSWDSRKRPHRVAQNVRGVPTLGIERASNLDRVLLL